MYIFEEYISRIKIKDNIIRYSEKSIVFLYNNYYEIIQINKILNSGKFQFIRKNLFDSFRNDIIEIDWNDYENYINNNLRSIRNALENKEDIFIANWEIFLIKNQKHLCDNYGHNFIYKTIDLSLSKKERIENILFFISFLKSNFDLIYNSWENSNSFLKNYSYWLAAIINEKPR